MYYRNAQAAVVVYDVTKAASLDKAKSWVKELQRQANPNIVIALCGNKLDLVNPNSPGDEESEQSTSSSALHDTEVEPDDATATPGENPASPGTESLRQVPKEEAQAYATEAGLLFFETSAKSGDGILEVFTEIAKKIPIEHILSSSRSGGIRGAPGGGRSTDTTVALDADGTRNKGACNC